MCPFAVDEAKLRDTIPGQDRSEIQLVALDPHKPPVKFIPHGEFPRVVYKHPNEDYVVIIHRNAKHEVVEEEMVPSEHLTKVVTCEAHEGQQGPIVKCEGCHEALKQALEEGWLKEPYIAKAPPSRNAGLYDQKPKTKAK